MPRPLRSDTARAIANLAIEVGDPGRMAKARRLHRKGAVTGTDVMPRSATSSVIDGDESHTVQLDLDSDAMPGEIPSPQELTTLCDCDEGESGGDDPACRHILAGLLGLAEAFETNARLLDEWTDTPREVTTRTRSQTHPVGFFGEEGKHRSIPTLPPRPRIEFPSLEVEQTAAGPVFEDATQAIRQALSPYRPRQ